MIKQQYLVEGTISPGDSITFTKEGKAHKSKEGEDVHFITDRSYADGEYIVIIISEA